MSMIPEEWGEPDSRAGLVYDVLWFVLAILVFGFLAYFKPFSIDVTATPRRLLEAGTLGVVLGSAISFMSIQEWYREFWADQRHRFVAIFGVVMGVQVGVMLVPAWTILTMLATFITVIPTRLYVYLRTT